MRQNLAQCCKNLSVIQAKKTALWQLMYLKLSLWCISVPYHGCRFWRCAQTYICKAWSTRRCFPPHRGADILHSFRNFCSSSPPLKFYAKISIYSQLSPFCNALLERSFWEFFAALENNGKGRDRSEKLASQFSAQNECLIGNLPQMEHCICEKQRTNVILWSSVFRAHPRTYTTLTPT